MKHRLLLLAFAAGCVTQTTEGGGDTGIPTTQPDVQVPDGVSPSDTPKPLPDLPVVDECESDDDCDDGLFCNGAERCNPVALGAGPNGCLAGEPPIPEDDNLRDCVVPSSCNEETDTFDTVVLAAGDACDDGIACTRDDVCTPGGSCAGTPHDPRCDDGLFCNGVEHCSGLVGCVAGAAPEAVDSDPADCLVPGACDESVDGYPMVPAEVGRDCNDGIACTLLDACTSAGTCAGVPSDAECSDGIFCNGAEVCTVGVGCGPGTPGPGPDPDPNDCLGPGSCDEAAGAWTWVPLPANTACDDGVACTSGDACDANGACSGAADDTACDDGLFCNGAERCVPEDEGALEDGCIGGEAPAAPADDTPGDCWGVGACDEATKGFPAVQLPESSACDDGVACTAGDACDAAGACAGTPDNSLCDDGAACNGLETCGAEGCEAGTPLAPDADPDPSDCWVWSECTEGESHFSQVAAPADTACDDGVACTANDVCDGLGVCGGAPDDAACDDGQFCNGAERCAPDAESSQADGCVAGEAPTAPADETPDDCFGVGACDETTQSFPLVPLAPDTACDDGITCTLNDVCDATGTCGGTPDDGSCEDGSWCNGAEQCQAGVGCQDGTPPPAPELGVCDAEVVCDEAADTYVLLSKIDGTSCGDSGVCESGVCVNP